MIIHKLLSYQVRKNYLPFQYFTPTSVDVLLLMSALVLNICTKIHLIYLIIVSCPLRNVLIASLRERERTAGEGTTTTMCNLDFKASCKADWREKPSTHCCFFLHCRQLCLLFLSTVEKMWSSFTLFSILKVLTAELSSVCLIAKTLAKEETISLPCHFKYVRTFPF